MRKSKWQWRGTASRISIIFGIKSNFDIFSHTAKLTYLSKQTVEEILQEIVTASSRLNHIPTQHLPEQIAEPILSRVARRLVVVKG